MNTVIFNLSYLMYILILKILFTYYQFYQGSIMVEVLNFDSILLLIHSMTDPIIKILL